MLFVKITRRAIKKEHENFPALKKNALNAISGKFGGVTVRFLAVVILVAFVGLNLQAATRTSVASGNWSAATTWSGATMPTASDSVIIAGGFTVTVNVSSASCAGMEIGSPASGGGNGTLTFANGSQLVVTRKVHLGNSTRTGSITMTNGGTLICTAITISNLKTWTPGAGTVQLTATNTMPSALTTYNNLIIAGGTSTLGASITINGTLTANSGAVFNAPAYTLTVTGATSVSGTLNITSTTGTKTFTGNVTINSGGTWNNSANEAVSLAGSLQNDGTFTAGTGVYTVTGAAKTFGGTISIPSLTISGTYTNNGTLTVSTALAGAGTLTNGATGILFITQSTAPAPAIAATTAGNTVNYNRAGTQTLKATSYYNLILSGTSAKTVTGSTVNGTLSLQGTATTTGTIPTYGASAVIEYAGSSAQTTGIEMGTTVAPGVTINNASGVILSAGKTFNGTLTFVNGKLSTGTYTLTAGTVNGASQAGYVYGNLLKKFTAGGPTTKTFEIGDATKYAPISVTINNVTVAGSLTAKATGSEHPNIATSGLVSAKDVNRYWTLTNTGMTFDKYSATFNWQTGDVDAGANTANFVVAKYTSSAWTLPASSGQTGTSITASGLTTVGDFAIGEPTSLTITASAGANGTISPSGAVSVPLGNSQHFSIAPNTGYYVDSLIVDGSKVTSDTQYTFTNVTGNHTIRATFTINTFTITSSAGANGAITPNGAIVVPYNGSQHFSIIPNTGYHVDSLIVDGLKVTSDTQYTFTNVTAPHTIRATFAINTFTITSSAGANGFISPTPSVSVNYGLSQHFSIAPNAGYSVDSLIIDGSKVASDTQYTFTSVTANHTIKATFAISTFTITSSAGANGAVAPNGAIVVAYDGSQHFSIAPNAGYSVDSLIIDGSKLASDTQYTFTNVTASHTIRATFAINTFTITSSAGANGAVTPSGAVVVAYNGSQHFSIIPNTGYHVDSLIIDGLKVTSDTQYTFTNITTNHSIRATFAKTSFTITASSGTKGEITPNGIVYVDLNATQHFSIAPNAGYSVDSLIVDGLKVASDTQYTFTNVTASHTIRATFAINTFTITSSAGANGFISPTPSVSVNYGLSQHFSIAPNAGYSVDSLIIDGSKVASDTQYTFTSVTANHTIKATFAISTFTITSSAGANGAVTPNGAIVVAYDGSQHFSIAPNAGYSIDSLIIDRSKVASDTQYTFTNVFANHTIRATFAANTFTITSSAGANGAITPSGAIVVAYNGSQHFSIAPNTGYHVDSLIIDGSKVVSDTQYTFTNVTANHTIRATFAANTFTITSSAGMNGTIAPNGAIVVAYDGSQHFSIAPSAGYSVDSLIVDGSKVTSDTQYTFTNVTANHAIRATFTQTGSAADTVKPVVAITLPADGATVSGTVNISANASDNVNVTSVQFTLDGANLGAAITSSPYTYSWNTTQALNGSHTIAAIARDSAGNSSTATIPVTVSNTVPSKPDLWVYQEALPSSWINASWAATITFGSTEQAYAGSNSIKVAQSSGGALSLHSGYWNSPVEIDPAFYSGVEFAIYGGASGLTISALLQNDAGTSFSMISCGTVAANTWRVVSVPMSQLDPSNISFDRFDILEQSGTAQTYYIDNLRFIGATTSNNTFTIAASAGTNGTITPNGTITVAYNGSQHFSIVPNSGYHVDSLIIDGILVASDTGYTFNNVTANHSINVTFKPVSFIISASTGSNGSITPNGAVYVNAGVAQHFSITPNTGYHMDSLIVDGTRITADTQYTFNNIAANHTIRATFAVNTFTITASAGANGSITPGGTVTIAYNGSQNFSISPIPGYHVDSLFIDGVRVTADTQYTFSNVTANHTIRATFSNVSYTITANAGTGGSISPSGIVSVNAGASQHFSIIPNTSYHVDSLIVDGAVVAADTQYNFTNIAANHTFRATFSKTSLYITASAGANGTITPSGTVYVNAGASQHFSIISNAGYHVDSIFVDGISVTADTQYTFTNVQANHTISVKFATRRYTITASAGTSGSISPAGTLYVDSMVSQRFVLTPDYWFKVESLFVDGVSVVPDTQYTFTNVKANHSISATFYIPKNPPNIAVNSDIQAMVNQVSQDSITATLRRLEAFKLRWILSQEGLDSLAKTRDWLVSKLQSYGYTNVQLQNFNEYGTTLSNVIAVKTGSVYPDSTIILSSHYDSVNGPGIDDDGSAVAITLEAARILASKSFDCTVKFIFWSAEEVGIDGSRYYVQFYAVPNHEKIRIVINNDMEGYSAGKYLVNVQRDTLRAGTIPYADTLAKLTELYSALDTRITIARNSDFIPFSYYGYLTTGFHEVTRTPYYHSQGDSLIHMNPDYTTEIAKGSLAGVAYFALSGGYTIQATAGANGTISPGGAVRVYKGGSMRFSITPNAGCYVDSVIVDGARVATDTQYTFSNIQANHTIRALFVANVYTITASAGANGSISPNGTVSVTGGSSKHFSIVPNSGYHVDSLIIDGTKVVSDTQYTITNISANHTIRATFTQSGSGADTVKPVVSIASPADGATVSGTTAITANASDNVKVTSVQFTLDGTNLGAAITTSPYTYSWNTTQASNGSHTIAAIARDSAGNSSTATISVTVSNTVPSTQDLWVYQESLASLWINASWSATVTFGSTEQAYAGSNSIKVVQSSGGGISLHSGYWNATVPIDPALYTGVEFAIYGGASGLTISALFQNDAGTSFPMISCGTVAANTWKIINVSMSQLDPSNLSFDRFDILERSGTAKTYYVDNLRFIGVTTPGSKTTARNIVGDSAPTMYALEQNYPNPFNPTTILHFALPEASEIRLVIYNVLGQAVKTLSDGIQQTGYHEVEWNASNAASGVYFYRIDATSINDPSKHFSQIRKMLLIK